MAFDRKAWAKSYYLKNKDKLKDQMKAWHTKNRASCNERQRLWCQENQEKVRAKSVKYKYGLEWDTYQQMQHEQNGLCALCGVEPATHVDHDHLTGLVRGLLCDSCNKNLAGVESLVGKCSMKHILDYLTSH